MCLQDKLDSCLNPQRDWVRVSESIRRRKEILPLIHRLQDIAQLRGDYQIKAGNWLWESSMLKFEPPLDVPYYGEILGVLTSDYSHHTWMPFSTAVVTIRDCWIARAFSTIRRVIFSMSQTSPGTFSKTIKNLPTCSIFDSPLLITKSGDKYSGNTKISVDAVI